MQDGTEPLGGLRRTHRCGELRTEHVGQEVVLMGWVHRRRDLGGLIFVELRDREGLAQCVFDSAESKSAFALAERLRSEYVVAVEGKVLQRSPQTVNPNLATGEVEVHVDRLRLLNPSRELPILVAEEQNVDESKRMQYRYLDLRRPRMTRNIVLRHRFTKAVRDFLDSVGFLEIETPMLVRSTPEGARDYLVPSRVHPGSFYALPQSPQLFKQLLMVSGFDRYFQIARCFRDEDLRADRQPEFTQIDMEMSFVGQDDVFGVVEGLVAHVWSTVMEHEIQRPIRRMHYKEAAERYGSDKPDLRFGLELHSLDEIVRGSEFTPFEQALSSGGTVKALMVPGKGAISRKEQDEVGALVPGLKTFYASRQQGELKSSLLAKLGAERLEQVLQALSAGEGDLVVMAAGPAASLNGQLGRLRLELARRYELIPAGKYEFLWVVDFPLFAYDEESGRLVPEHHPFTSPHPEDAHMLDSDPRQVRAAAYDLVLNGNEVASGSIRIHQREMQEKVLSCIGLSIEDARQKFGFLLDAFEYGAPPHGGIALGLDRLVAICVGCDSIREVLAFPKNASAADPMTGAPVEVSQDQLDILHLNVRVPQGAR